MKPRVAFIGTGGTISSMGNSPLDLMDYSVNGRMMVAEEILQRFPEVALVADVFAVPFSNVPSWAISFPQWKALVETCDRLVATEPDLAGIVIGHGTATLEETAYALNLALKVPVPVVVVGSQRPASALSTDAGLNLLNAVRVAADPRARGLGTLVVLNDEIHPAREVTKTSTSRLQTFRAPDFGCLGHCDGDRISWYRKPVRTGAPDTEFDIRGLEALPRVDISYAYAGNDSTAVDAFLAAGAQGIVSAGFAPGFCGAAEAQALSAAAQRGVAVVQCSRAGSGRVFPTVRIKENGFIAADNLTPQKARILLSFALTVTKDPAEIVRMFDTY